MTSRPLPVDGDGLRRPPGTAAAAAHLDPDSPAAEIMAETGRCVACGLCVPKCPTYRKTLSEADSPRGRITLIRGVVEGRIPANDRLREHLDLCLGCRACEAVCPNGVAYGHLYDRSRALPAIQGAGPRGIGSLARRMLTPVALGIGGSLLRFYQRAGVQRVARSTGLLRRIGLERAEGFLPVLPKASRFRAFYPAAGDPVGEVTLFLGCVARIVDTEALQAAIHVLTRLGYGVHVPPGQGCCGALHSHAGDADGACALAEANQQAFAAFPELPIVSVVSGCGARLLDYAGHYGAAGRAVARRVIDVSAFLSQASGWDRVQCAPLPAKVAVHEPCTLQNVMRSGGAVQALLARVPGLSIEALAGNDQCCGAAGVYFLSQQQMADALRADKLAAIGDASPEFLVTSNVGCALFLAHGLRSLDLTTEVLHPVSLLARQLAFKGKSP
jgi:glycolate oxidase iron-sulfur subunit